LDAALTPEPGRANRAFAEFMLLIAGWSMVAWCVWTFAESFHSSQWDLEVYRRAGATYAAGADPYLRHGSELPFVYPPALLRFFSLLAGVPSSVAQWGWLIAKIAALCTWLRAAGRTFEPFRNDYASVLFLLFAFNGAIYIDFITGNVSVFEQALLWTAFGSLLRQRYVVFTLLVVATAEVKLAPLLFLLLLLTVPMRPRLAEFGLGLALVGVSWGVEALIWPRLCFTFIHQAVRLDESGRVNPSTYAVAKELAGWLGGIEPFWQEYAVLLYFLLAAGVVTWSGAVWWRRRVWLRANPAWGIVFATCSYALVLPRFKDYAYALLIVPAWMVIRRLEIARWGGWLAMFVLLPQSKSFLPTSTLTERLGEYLPWLAALSLLIAVGLHVERSGRVPST
jgi:hypothetical protein